MNASSSSTRTVIGMEYVQRPGPWWLPAGLESTQGPGAKPTYTRPPFFGADREYGPDEGWQTYSSRSQRRRTKRRSYASTNDTYEFDDSY